jgi:hypothetical protein
MTEDWKLPWQGGCRCGQLRVRVSEAPLCTSVCHCIGCQRMTGSAFSTTLILPSSGLVVTAGEPVIGGMHAPAHQHYHCAHCMSWVFTRIPGAPDIVSLKATMLDDAGWFVPFMETSTQHKLAWVHTPAVHSFTDMPRPEEYPALIADFARRSARP